MGQGCSACGASLRSGGDWSKQALGDKAKNLSLILLLSEPPRFLAAAHCAQLAELLCVVGLGVPVLWHRGTQWKHYPRMHGRRPLLQRGHMLT